MALLTKRSIPGLQMEVDAYENINTVVLEKHIGRGSPARVIDAAGTVEPATFETVSWRVLVLLDIFTPEEAAKTPRRPWMHDKVNLGEVLVGADISHPAIYDLLKKHPSFAQARDA